jgi:demethylmenaquinone methyltransferase / 2-methoxy-6-polyprenyl-1,4-benzoquinol methylase
LKPGTYRRGAAVPVPPPERRNSFAQRLFTPLPARYDRLAELLSFRQNGRWRQAMIDHLDSANGQSAAGTGQVVLDVAAGTAGISLQLASRLGGRVVGLDLTEQMLRQGQRNVAAAGAADQVVLLAGRAERLPFADATFDALTFSYLLRYVADPQATLSELARVVRPGGRIASLEFAVPSSPFWRACWTAYTATLLPLAGLVTGGPQWWQVGRFLGPNIRQHYRAYPVGWTVDAWQRAGIGDVGWSAMSLGGGLIMWGTRAGG